MVFQQRSDSFEISLVFASNSYVVSEDLESIIVYLGFKDWVSVQVQVQVSVEELEGKGTALKYIMIFFLAFIIEFYYRDEVQLVENSCAGLLKFLEGRVWRGLFVLF